MRARNKINSVKMPVITAALVIIVFGAAISAVNYYLCQKDYNIVLITVDALRPDHLGCYGYQRDTSPNLDRIAKQGIIFMDAVSQGGRTWPAIASLLTAAYPSTHRLYLEGSFLSPALATLPEILKAHQYSTGFIGGHGEIGVYGETRRKQVFDLFEDSGSNRSDLITEKALHWISGRKEKKFFLWLHYFDTHIPYNSPRDYSERYSRDGIYATNIHLPIAADDGFGKKIPKVVARQGITSVDYYVSLYDGAIKFTDDAIGRLVKQISALGLSRRTVFIITADHGEYLGERERYFFHGDLDDVIIKVPLIIMSEGVIPGGKIVSSGAGLVDIMPTVLSLLRIETSAKMEGINLLPFAIGKNNFRRCIFSEFLNKKEGVFRKSARTGEWKLIQDCIRDRYELYDLKHDPRELVDLAGKEKENFRRLKNCLDIFNERHQTSPAAPEHPLGLKNKQRLESLGYAQ